MTAAYMPYLPKLPIKEFCSVSRKEVIFSSEFRLIAIGLHKSAPSVDLVKVPLSSDVDNVNNWCRENGMIIN